MGVRKIENSKVVFNDQVRLKDLVFRLDLYSKDYLLRESKRDEDLVWQMIQKIHHHIENTPGTLEEDLGMPQDLQNFKNTFGRYVQLVELSKKYEKEAHDNINRARKASEMLRENALNGSTKLLETNSHNLSSASVQMSATSQRVNKNTKEVASAIDSLAQAIDGVAKSSENINILATDVSEINAQFEQAKADKMNIENAVMKINNVISEVNSTTAATEELSSTVADVNLQMQDISKATEENAQIVGSVSKAAEELNAIANNVGRLVSRFKI